mmetsp:Transcript_24978/g.40117  ORF Transcript_24978/g.40117 Transcript_24978/m.40117 type:complete len:556 (+) Transcript_24978:51-1718(+)
MALAPLKALASLLLGLHQNLHSDSLLRRQKHILRASTSLLSASPGLAPLPEAINYTTEDAFAELDAAFPPKKEKFSFRDERTRCIVVFPIDDDVRSKDISFHLEDNILTIGVKGMPPVIDAEPLLEKVIVDDAFWELDEEKDQRYVVLELLKSVPGRWDCLLKSQYVPVETGLLEAGLSKISNGILRVGFDRASVLECYEVAARTNFIFTSPRSLIERMLTQRFGPNVAYIGSDDRWSYEVNVTSVMDGGTGEQQDMYSTQIFSILSDELEAYGFTISSMDAEGMHFVSPQPVPLTNVLLNFSQYFEQLKDPSSYASDASRLVLDASTAQKFWNDGAIIIPGALQHAYGNDAADLLAADVDQVTASGYMSAAGSKNNHFRGKEFERDDRIAFLDEEIAMKHGLTALSETIRLMKGIAHELAVSARKSLFVNAAPQLGEFAPGGTYPRHVDGGMGQGDDVISIILFANSADWPEDAGGQLRLHNWPELSEQTDILPSGGTLVAFRSSMAEYEILSSIGRQRRALTLWAHEGRLYTYWHWRLGETAAEVEAREEATL